MAATRRKRSRKTENSTAATVGFEAQLWQAADALRGSMDAAEYKHVVLGLIFLKYISDAFEELHVRLEAERDQGADPEDPDEYRAQNVFWVPPQARWAHLKNQARQPTIGQLVDDAMEAVERDNPSLKGVLPKDYARPSLDKQRLGQLIDLISNIRVGDEESRSKDVLGRVYEYFLSQFATAEGRKGGEFYTPTCIVRLLVEMIEPYKGRVYDPCCGSGGMFVQSQHMIHHLAPTGLAGFVLANGSMSSNQSGEGEIRKAIIEADLVDCMIALPGQLFYSTQIPACLWFLARDKKGSRLPRAGDRPGVRVRDRHGEVLFIDARKMGRMVDRTHRELTEEEIQKIARTYHLWRGEKAAGEYEDVPGFCKSATLQEIRKHGHVLTPGRYVGAPPQEDDGEPFEEKMKRLTAQWRQQVVEARKLDEAIRKNLEELGYGD
jgi:type I restriction-modification system DNA methylase subunit